MSRKLRSILPVIPDELKTKVPVRVKELIKTEKEKQKEYYNRCAKPLTPLSVGDKMRYQEGKTWKQRIVTKEEGDRSYTVKNTDEAVYGRKKRHLFQSGEKFEPYPDSNIVCLSVHTYSSPYSPSPVLSTQTHPELQPEIKHIIRSAPSPTPMLCYGRTVKPKIIVSV